MAEPATGTVLRTTGELARAFAYPASSLLSLFALMDLFQLTKPNVRVGAVVAIFVVVAVGAAVVGVVTNYLRSAFVRFDADGVTRSRFPLGTKSFTYADIGSCIDVMAYRQAANKRPPRPLVMLLDRNGKRLLRMRATMWSEADMRRVVAAGAPTDVFKSVTTKELKKRYPHAISTFERHPITWVIAGFFGFWFVVLLIVAVASIVTTP